MTNEDPYLEKCVLCEHRPCVDGNFCNDEDCIEQYGRDHFGRCYECRDFKDHQHCVGVPCQCPCPPPDQLKREAEREAVLAKLTPAERAILGF